MLSEKLGLKMVNYTFRNLAVEMGIPFKELCQMAESDPQYDYKVDDTQVEIGKKGNCILGSRLAVWLLKEADLTVFLTASDEVRASRILKREGGDLEKRLAETKARDDRDHKRYLKLYNIDNEKYDFVDLVIDTEEYDGRLEDIVDLIAKKAGEIS